MSYFQPYIDASGIHMPTYEDRLQDLLSAYRSIFGQEAELTLAVPDYQLPGRRWICCCRSTELPGKPGRRMRKSEPG